MKNIVLAAGVAAAIYALTRRAPAAPPSSSSSSRLIIDRAEYGSYEDGLRDITEEISLKLDASGVLTITPDVWFEFDAIDLARLGERFIRITYRLGSNGAQQVVDVSEFETLTLPYE